MKTATLIGSLLIVLSLSIGSSPVLAEASAKTPPNTPSTLTPSLQKQMQRQAIINANNRKNTIDTQQKKRLEAIRKATLLREKTAALSTNNPTSTPSFVPENPNKGTYIAGNIVEKPNIDTPLIDTVGVLPISDSNTVTTDTTAGTVFTTETNSEALNVDTSIQTLSGARQIGNIDMRRVENTWLGWNNDLRKEMGLPVYTINDRLNQTAQEWSEFSRDRGYITHSRPGDNCIGETNYGCYNFQAIDDWFQARNIQPKIINRSKHTENLGIGSFTCKSSDCTDAVIEAIRKTYDFFYSEKSYNGLHWRSLVSPYFTQIGVGFAQKNDTFYFTVHYVTSID